MAKKEKVVVTAPVSVDKAGLIEKVTSITGLSYGEAERAVTATFETIMNFNAQGDTVAIKGFGKFEPRKRNARNGRNPQTGETIEIAETVVPALSTGATYKSRVASKTPEWGSVKAVEKEPKETVNVTVDKSTASASSKGDKKKKKKKKK